MLRWWWAQAIQLTCLTPSCKRIELVDLNNPSYAEYAALPEPRKAMCSHCVVQTR